MVVAGGVALGVETAAEGTSAWVRCSRREDVKSADERGFQIYGVLEGVGVGTQKIISVHLGLLGVWTRVQEMKTP